MYELGLLVIGGSFRDMGWEHLFVLTIVSGHTLCNLIVRGQPYLGLNV